MPRSSNPVSHHFVVRGGGGADDRAVQLGVFTDGDVKAAFAREDAGLLNHAVVVAVHFVTAEVDAGGAGHGAEGKAAADAGVLLLRVVAVS